MAVSNELLANGDVGDFYKNMLLNQIWQQQLASGANLANAGWKTALGLAIGSGLGNWLGYKFGNYQRNRDDARQYGMNNPAVRAAVNNFLGGEADLGWKPQYQFKTPREYFFEAVTYNPNTNQVQDAVNRALPVNNFLPPLQQKPPPPTPEVRPTVNTPIQQQQGVMEPTQQATSIANQNQWTFPTPTISEYISEAPNPYKPYKPYFGRKSLPLRIGW